MIDTQMYQRNVFSWMYFYRPEYWPPNNICIAPLPHREGLYNSRELGITPTLKSATEQFASESHRLC